MKEVKCPAGHTYDGDAYLTCPCCDIKEQSKASDQEAIVIPVMCSNFHYYDSRIYHICPVCGVRGSTPLVPLSHTADNGNWWGYTLECEKGHVYNGQVYKECPYCHPVKEKEEQEFIQSRQRLRSIKTISIWGDAKMESERPVVVQCPQGHFYDSSVYTSCPHCNGADKNK